MMRSLFTGVSGLKQNQTRMDVTSNNIANVNTTAFKKGRVMFQDLFSQTLKHAQQAFGAYGGTNPMQVGLGVRTASVDTMMEQGNLESTGKNTDLAIEGAGFFVIKNGQGYNSYTRDGNFSINPSYDLVMTNTGFKVQGWLAEQNPNTGNLEIRDNGLVPYDINVTKFLKKHAHQTNNVIYASNLDAGSDERDIKMGVDTLSFQDTTGNYQNLKFKFKKMDAQNWLWSAHDDSEGNVATGTIKTDPDGKVLETTVNPAGMGSITGQPFFTYDPDGTPLPATATTLVNSTSNAGTGAASGVIAQGTDVKDETVSVIFDGGDPTQAVSFRVVGSDRGYIGNGTLGGKPATITGSPVDFTGNWVPSGDVSFDIGFSQERLTGDTDPFRAAASITFSAGTAYSANSIINTINTQLKSSGVPATAYYDGVTHQITFATNATGSNRTLSVSNVSGPLNEIGLDERTADGIGGSKPEVLSTLDFNANDPFTPTSDISLTITDRYGHSAVINMPQTVGGADRRYTRSDIITTFTTALQSNNVDVSVEMLDSNNDNEPDRLVLRGIRTGLGETFNISGDATSLDQLGLVQGTFNGTANVATFDQGGLSFSLTEGTVAWRPNDVMTATTTAQKGQADSVNIYVPAPHTNTLTFSTEVNTPNGLQKTEITGAVSLGAKHTTSITVYDSLGSPHELVTTWEHTNTLTQEWTYKISYGPHDPELTAWLADPANGILDPANPTPDDLERANNALITDRKGTIFFLENGKIDSGKSYVPPIKMTPRMSVPVTINLDMELATQFNSPFTTAAREQDGYEMGLLNSVYFEQDGTIRGVYSNGQKQPIGQLSMAEFNNPGGLEKEGKNLYNMSPNSGSAVLGKPGTSQRGVIVPGALEMSNVDIAEEFTSMIITQRAFSANSRVITTSDEMLQEVVNLKR